MLSTSRIFCIEYLYHALKFIYGKRPITTFCRYYICEIQEVGAFYSIPFTVKEKKIKDEMHFLDSKFLSNASQISLLIYFCS